MGFMPGGKCLIQTDEEAEEEYEAVQRLLPLFKKSVSEKKVKVSEKHP